MSHSVVVISTTKGGAGKTTLALCLATQWHMLGTRIGLIDADPQESLASVIGDATLPISTTCETDWQKLPILIAEMRHNYNRLIIDTAGFTNRTALYAMAMADLVLIPCRTARTDIDQLRRTYKLIKQIETTPERRGRALPLRAVITQANLRTQVIVWTRQALLESKIPTLNVEIANHAIYQEISFTGNLPALTAPTSPAAEEIRKLTAEIDALLNTSSEKTEEILP